MFEFIIAICLGVSIVVGFHIRELIENNMIKNSTLIIQKISRILGDGSVSKNMFVIHRKFKNGKSIPLFFNYDHEGRKEGEVEYETIEKAEIALRAFLNRTIIHEEKETVFSFKQPTKEQK